MEGGMLNREALAGKLRQLNNTQQSIENTANWCLFYSKEAKSIVAVWDEELRAAPVDKKLAMMYLANHILQESRKKGREFTEEFPKVIVKATKDLLRAGDAKTRGSMSRVVKIWEERRVFGSAVVKALKEVQASAEAAHSAAARSSGQQGHADAKKLQVLGTVGEALLEAHAASDKSSHYNAKIMQLRPNLHVDGSEAEVKAARDLLASSVAALQAEAQKRQRTIAELRQAITKQEEGLRRCEQQLPLYVDQRTHLEERLSALATPPPAAAPTPSPANGTQQPQQQAQQQPNFPGAPPGMFPGGPNPAMMNPLAAAMGPLAAAMGLPFAPMPGMVPGMMPPTPEMLMMMGPEALMMQQLMMQQQQQQQPPQQQQQQHPQQQQAQQAQPKPQQPQQQAPPGAPGPGSFLQPPPQQQHQQQQPMPAQPPLPPAEPATAAPQPAQAPAAPSSAVDDVDAAELASRLAADPEATAMLVAALANLPEEERVRLAGGGFGAGGAPPAGAPNGSYMAQPPLHPQQPPQQQQYGEYEHDTTMYLSDGPGSMGAQQSYGGAYAAGGAGGSPTAPAFEEDDAPYDPDNPY